MGGKSSPEYHRLYREKHKERLKAQAASRYLANREEARRKAKEYRELNRERLSEYDRWRRSTPEGRAKKAAADAAYRAKNREILNAKRVGYFAARKAEKRRYDIDYRAANAGKLKARYQAYYRDNRPAYYARVQKRNARQLRATPSWADDFLIDEAYRLAELRTKMLGYKWDVDHIVPLRSPLVCGLHVQNNLAVIPASVNRSKGNRYWPDMP